MQTELMVPDMHCPERVSQWQQVTGKLKGALEKQRYLRPDFLGEGAQVLLTTRCGGKSQAPFDSFNLGLHVGDNPDTVQRNREILLTDIGCRTLCFMNQTHSNKVLRVSTPEGQGASALPCASTQERLSVQDWQSDMVMLTEPIVRGLDCDGLVTNEKGLALAVMTADCLPVLMYEPHAQVVAAIHCGWKGVFNDILDQTLQQMGLLGAQATKVRALIGPGIEQRSFEVGEDFKQAFLSESAAYEQYFAPEGCPSSDGKVERVQGKYLCDLHGILKSKMLRAGLHSSNIEIGAFDTYQQDELFYSYRRQKDTGRMASVVWLG